MRRPLKPFVTEYKGSRRAPPAFSEPIESERPAPKPATAMKARPFDVMKAEHDDSYEAAMRAADALFSNNQGRPSSPAASSSNDAAEAPTIFESPRQSSVPDPTGADTAAPVPDRGGRILRVVDEAPPPQLAALEAQHAPKRRGRKPGSKNKPKVVPASSPPLSASNDLEREAPVVAVAPEPAAAVPAADPTEAHQVEARQIEADQDAAHQVAAHQVAAHQVEALPSSAVASRGERRFSWARGRLKPGEEWKRRRLPRICW